MGQNSLRDCLTDFYYELIRMNLSVQYSEAGIKLSGDELKMMARMESYSYVSVIFEWVKSGMHNDYMNYINQLYNIRKMELSYYKMTKEPDNPF